MSTEYDPNILQSFADDLYKQARYIVITTALRYGLITFLVSLLLLGGLSSYIPHRNMPDEGSWLTVSVLIVTLMGVAVGISEGNRKAFQLRLEAQKLLCQKRIESHTRHMVIEQRKMNPL